VGAGQERMTMRLSAAPSGPVGGTAAFPGLLPHGLGGPTASSRRADWVMNRMLSATPIRHSPASTGLPCAQCHSTAPSATTYSNQSAAFSHTHGLSTVHLTFSAADGSGCRTSGQLTVTDVCDRRAGYRSA